MGRISNLLATRGKFTVCLKLIALHTMHPFDLYFKNSAASATGQ